MREGRFNEGIEQIEIGQEYLVFVDGTSDGTQDKYFKNGIWYKPDKLGTEGYNEYFVSEILKCTNLDPNKYVEYKEVIINGVPGCRSNSFLKEQEEYVSLYRLYKNIVGRDIAIVFQQMDFDDQADFLVDFVKKETGVDINEMLGELFFIDGITLNDDRHLNNIGLIFDGMDFRPAPIFDNGKSFFCGNKHYDETKDLKDNLRYVRSRPFVTTNALAQMRFPIDVTIDNDKLQAFLNSQADNIQKRVVSYTMKKWVDK